MQIVPSINYSLIVWLKHRLGSQLPPFNPKKTSSISDGLAAGHEKKEWKNWAIHFVFALLLINGFDHVFLLQSSVMQALMPKCMMWCHTCDRVDLHRCTTKSWHSEELWLAFLWAKTTSSWASKEAFKKRIDKQRRWNVQVQPFLIDQEALELCFAP